MRQVWNPALEHCLWPYWAMPESQKELEVEPKAVYDAGNENLSVGADAGTVGRGAVGARLAPRRATLAEASAVGQDHQRRGVRFAQIEKPNP